MEYSNDNKLNQQGKETESQRESFSGIPLKSLNHNLKIIIGVLVVLLVAGFYISKNKTATKNEQTTLTGNITTAPESTTLKPTEQTINYDVVLKENPNDKTKISMFI